MKNLLQKLAIMSIIIPASLTVSLLSSSTNAILEEYAMYPTSLVTSMISSPTLSLLVGLILAPVLMRKFPAKNIVLAGLMIFGVFSALPALITDFYGMFLCRIIGGIGCGMILPLQPTYAATYPEKERAGLLGLSAACSCLTAAVLIAVSGLLVPGGWRRVFLLYLVALIPFVLALFVLPKDPYAMQAQQKGDADTVEVKETNSKKQNANSSMKSGAIGVVVAFLFLIAANYVCTAMMGVEIGQYINQTGLGDSTVAGFVLSMNFIGALIGGLIMSTYTKITGKMGIPIIFFFCSVGSIILWCAPSIGFVFAGCLMIGLFASMQSVLVLFELSKILPLEIYTVVSAMCNMVTFVIQFLSPLVFLGILNMTGGSFRTVFGIYGVFLGLMIMVSFVLTHKKTAE